MGEMSEKQIHRKQVVLGTINKKIKYTIPIPWFRDWFQNATFLIPDVKNMLPLQHKIIILHFTGNSYEDFLYIQFVVFPCFFVLFFFYLPFMKWSNTSDFSKDTNFHFIIYKSSRASFFQSFIM